MSYQQSSTKEHFLDVHPSDAENMYDWFVMTKGTQSGKINFYEISPENDRSSQYTKGVELLSMNYSYGHADFFYIDHDAMSPFGVI